MYREFTECINLCDVGENLIITKTQTIKQPLEHEYTFNSKLSIREFPWRIPEINVRNNKHNRQKIQLGKFFQSIQRRIKPDRFKRYSPGSLQFESHLALSNDTNLLIRRRINQIKLYSKQ